MNLIKLNISRIISVLLVLVGLNVYASKVINEPKESLSILACPVFTLPAGPVGFCTGDSVILDCGSADSVLWSNGKTTQKITLKAVDIAGTSKTFTVSSKKVGCTAITKSIVVNLNPLPVAKFANTAVACVGSQIQYTDSSTITPTGALTYKWTFSVDGSDSTSQNPSKLYSTVGSYTVKLEVTSLNACKANTTKSVSITPGPVANFSSTNITGCKNNIEKFTNSSTISSGSITKSLWSFGNGVEVVDSATNALKTESQKYVNSGSFDINLQVYSSNGCSNSITKTFIVKNIPSTAFSVSTLSTSATSNFTNATSITPSESLTYKWNYGELSNTSTLTSPIYKYTNSGPHTVQLISTSTSGCKDTLSKSITINGIPVANFTTSTSSACANTVIDFTNTSTLDYGAMNYLWDFGNGNTSTLQNPSTNYFTPGTYTVTLIVKENEGGADTVTKNITINPLPKASFTLNNACLNELVNLTNNSTIFSGTYTNAWDFGDGSTSTQNNPSHSFTSANTFKVKLVTTSNIGCIDSTIANILVAPIPVANFTVNPIFCSGESVVVTNTSSLSSGIMISKWTSGNGNSSTDLNPSFEYYTNGTYSITLIASSSNGCADTVTKNISINPKPSISFYGTTPNGGNVTTFTNKSSIVSGTMTYLWDIQTMGTFTSQNTSVVFKAPGTFTVKLTATSDQNCVNTKTQNYEYVGDASVPKVFVPTDTVGFYMYGSKITVIKGTQLYINGSLYNTINSGNNQKGNIQNLDSIFIAGNIQNNTKLPLFLSKDGGTVVFRDGFIQTISRDTVNFKNIVIDKIKQNLVLNRGITVGKYLTLKKGTVNFVTYKIDLLDSGLVVGETPFNFLTGDKGWLIARNRHFSIGDSLDKASLGLILSPYGEIGEVTLFRRNSSQDSAGEGGIRRFYDVQAGMGGYSKLKFNYLDAEFAGLPKNQNENTFKLWYSNNADSTVQNATQFKQDTNSVADITLNNVKSDSANFIATKYQRVTVSDADCDIAPILTLPTKPQWICEGDTLTLDAGTAVNSWKWSNGKSTQTVKIVASSITGPKDTLSVECYNKAGCRAFQEIVINKKLKPKVNFTKPVSVCKGAPVLYSNKTTVADSQGLAYLWTFYDGTTSTEQNPKFKYDVPSIYKTKLVVTTAYNCIASISDTSGVKVNDVPQAAIQLSTPSVCAKTLVSLFNLSTIGNSEGIAQSEWSFGDSFTSSKSDTSAEYKAYSKEGTYEIKLKIRSSGNCYDSTFKTITVNPIPVSAFIVKGFTTNLPTSFNATSTINSSEPLYYKWTFDSLGASSVDNNPVYVYDSSKTHLVTLITTSLNGCIDTVSQLVVTTGNPVADFTFSSPDFCEYSNVNFVDASSIDVGSTTSLWTFGDGTSSIEKNPSKKYSKPGIYVVSLQSTAEGGGTNVITKNVTINAAPDAQFYVAPVCFGSISKFVNNSKIESGTISNAWTFGDLSTASIDAPSHIYATNGTFKVQLITISNAGCVDTVIQNAVVNEMPVADFDITDVCIGFPTAIVNNSSISNGTLSYNWVLGNNLNSSEETPIVTYATAGDYILDLIVSSNAGCAISSSKKTTVFPAPNVKFSNTLACHGDTTYFTNQSTISSGTLTYLWDFGANETSTVINAKKVFASPNVYTVQLKAISNNLCETSLTKLVNVNPLPIVDFSSNNTCIGNATNFVNNSSISAPITANALTYTWTFGNNKTSNLSNPSLTYTQAKVYDVKLTAQSIYGCTASKTSQVQVYDLPIALFSVANVCTGAPLTIVNNSKSSDGQALIFDWNFGDGTSSTDSIPSKTYSNEKLNNIELNVTSSKGCVASYSNSVNIYPKPIISLNSNSKSCLNQAYVITNNTTIKSGTFTNTWDLGNGSTSIAINPTTTYAAIGAYNINYKVISDKGCEASITSTVTVNPLPVVAFDVSNDVLSNVVFENKSTISSNESLSYNWNFGNGASSSLANPIYKYALDGNYSVTLKASSVSGCIASITRTVKYPNSSIADFVDFETQGALCKTNQIQFLNKSDVGSDSLSYLWKFNDGTTSTLENPTKTFKTTGTFNVQLLITPKSGVSISKTKSIIINDLPKVSFIATDICVNDKVQFVNKSTPISNVSYQWDLGDGTTSSLSSPNKTYAIDGNYSAKLSVTTLAGCTANTTQTFKVNAIPTLNLGDTLRTCGATLPIIAGNNLNTYQWSTGATNAQILASINGEYQVKATNTIGCSASDTVIVYLNDQLKINLGADKSVCNNFEFDAKNQGATYLWSTGTVTPKLKITSAGTYFVSVTDVNNCNAKDTITVTLLPSPIAVKLGNDTSICDSRPFKLDVNQVNASYKWLNGSTSSSIEIKASGIYAVAVSNANGCTSKDTISIDMKASPKFSLGPDTIICANELPFYLNAWAKANSYIWSNSAVDSTISVTSSGVYIAKALASNACSFSDTVSVTINANPIVNLGNDVLICSGSSVVLNANSLGNQVKWSTGDNTQTVSANLAGIYSVEATNTFGCKAKDNITVTEKTIDKPNLGKDLKLCTYDFPKTIIAPSGYTSYSWLNRSNTSKQIISNTTEDLILEVKDSINCIAYDTLSVIQLNTPSVELGTDTSFCKGNIFKLNAQNIGAHYLWSNGDTSQTITVNLAGIYGVNVNFDNGCKASDERNVTMYLAPKVDLGSDKNLCKGQTWQLNAANSGATYLWSTTETSQDITVSTSANYKVEIIDNHGCKANDEVLVTFENANLPTLGTDISSCKSVVLDAGTTANAYLWSTNETTRNITINKSGEYVVSTFTVNKCIASDTINVNINSSPKLNLGIDTSICANQSLILNAQNLGSSYVWSTSEVSQTIKTNKAGQYFVRITNASNCTTSDTINVGVNAITNFNLGNDKDICKGSIAALKGPVQTNGVSYLWNTGEISDNINVTTSGDYSLTFTNNKNCKTKDTIHVDVHEYPVVSLGKDTSVCGKIILDAKNSGNKYLWNDKKTTQLDTVLITGLCYVNVTSPFNCTSRDSINIEIKNKPTVNVGNDIVGCKGDTTLLSVSTDATTFNWNTLETTQKIKVINGGNYFVNASNTNGCTNSDTLLLTIKNKPTLVLKDEYVVCSNAIQKIDAGNSGSSFTWTSDKGFTSSQQSIVISGQGTYYLKIKNKDGCIAQDTIVVKASPNAVYANFLSVSGANVGDTVKMLNMSYPQPFTSKWTFGDGLISTETDPIHVYYLDTTVLTRTLTVTNGFCTDTKTKTIKVYRKKQTTVPIQTAKLDYIISANVYPIPNDGRFVFETELAVDESIHLDLFDLEGHIISSKDYNQSRFHHTMFEHQELKSGMYFLRMIVQNQSKIFKIIIAK